MGVTNKGNRVSFGDDKNILKLWECTTLGIKNTELYTQICEKHVNRNKATKNVKEIDYTSIDLFLGSVHCSPDLCTPKAQS